MKKVFTGALIVASMLVAAYLYQKYRIAPGIQFETLELTSLNGQPVKLQDYKGKKLFINFFATWCGSCIAEFPALDNAAGTLMPDNFVFISISDEPLALLNKANTRLSLQHITILHSVKKLKQLDIVTYPTSYLLNDKGKVVFKKAEEAAWDTPEMIQTLKQNAD
jgi:thiol-disulfide isomerase/thioredoxin